jgi:ABC-type branched-subunit amino acid transport system substrate-binding protein
MNPPTNPAPTRRRCLERLAGGTLAALAAPVVRAADEGVTTDEIRIGQTITLQGGKNVYGAAVMQGIKLHLDTFNAGPRVHGRRVVLKTLDDDNKTAQAEANARELIAGGAFVLFGSLEGGPSTAVAAVAAQAGVPLFGPMAGSPTLRRPHQPLVFPVRAEHREEFRALMGYAHGIGMTRVGLFHSDSDVGRQHLENVRLLAQELNTEVVAALPFKPDVGDAGIAELVQQIAARKPQVMLNHGSPSAYEKLIRAGRAAGLPTQFFGVNSGSTQLARALGPLAVGMVFAQVVPNPYEGKTLLAREYQQAAQAAGAKGDYSYGALEGFMTAKALVLALRAAGPRPTRASLLAALESFQADLGGVRVRYAPGQHEGSRFVDLAMVGRDGRFIH